ncbi:MAG: DUF1015 domain-containing protein [Alphaproteobacteria bacterium]|nr:DUF1015 domain-containing protein [Alphaproteobacteria bacterium]
MARIKPFRGVRPRSDLAERVVAPPYDVLNEAEARAIVARDPDSFLRVTRPEVNLPEGSDPHGAAAYASGREALNMMLMQGTLEQDRRPGFYFYGQRMGEHEQVALMALCSVQEYDRGLIKKHEYTRPDKEQDRVDHINGVNAQTGLVFLAYRQDPHVAEVIAHAMPSAPLFRVTTDDGVVHTLWRVENPSANTALEIAFANVPALYIADGHHRSAAASRVSAARGGRGGSDWFLAGLFPDDALQVLAYNRLVTELGGRDAAAFRAALAEDFTLEPVSEPAPERAGTYSLYIDGAWWRMTPKPGVVDASDPVASLDVAVLQDHVLDALIGITDPRRDERVSFVGGIRGHRFLSDAVDRGEAMAAFALYPTSLEQLFAVADADRVMPPKSTWFEPKLRGGVLVHVLESEGA